MLGEKCFLIEGKELFLKALLVEYDFVPLFYVCVDEDNHYYTVLRRSLEEETYIIVQNKKEHIVQMLRNEITMRHLMMSEPFYWEIIAGEDITSDIVERKQLLEMPIKDLPLENAKYGKATIESEQLLKELNFNPSTKDSSSMDFIFDMMQNQYDDNMGERLRMYVEMIFKEQLKNRSLFTVTGYVQKKPIIRQTTDYTVSDTEDTVCVNANANMNEAA